MTISFKRASLPVRSQRFARHAVVLLLLCGSGFANTVLAQTDGADANQLAAGRQVAVEGDCAACHTSNKDQPFAGGRAIHSPMGTIYASNITPSTTHGIGGYSEQQFSDAVRKGINAKGEHLYPAMPYTAYRGISDADMHALYVYFMQGVKPVDTATPKTKLSFPFDIREVMAVWNLLYLSHGAYQNDAALSPELNRGKYLVDTLAHCSTCHTPRNVMMAERSDAYLGGANVDGWIAPNITSDPISGIGGWSEDDLAAYLKNGHVIGKGQAGGGMAEAVEWSLRYLSDADLHNIAAYLKTVPPIHDAGDSKPAFNYDGAEPIPTVAELEPQRPDNSVQPEALRTSDTEDGSVLYSGACASCHQPTGKGTQNQYFPSLSNNRAVGMSTSDNLVMAILHGVDRQGSDGHVFMPAFGRDMSDAQVAAVANYVSLHFGNRSVHTTPTEVAQIRSGGAKPTLIKIMPILLAAGAIAILLIIALILLLIGRRRHAHEHF